MTADDTSTTRQRLQVAVRIALLLLALMLTGAFYQWTTTRLRLAGQPAPGRLIDIGGYRLHLYCLGQGNPTVILDAGLGDSYLVWSWVQPRIAAITRVCSYDRAGAGYSEPTPFPRTSEVIAGELHTLLTRAGITGPLVLVGWSAAGLYARAYASTFPGEVAGLVLVDASHEDQWERLPAASLIGIDDYFRSLRWATFRMAVGIGRLPRPGGHRLWSAPFDPETENNLALQMPIPDAKRAYAMATGYRLSWFRETLGEWEGFRASRDYVRRTRKRLDIPVIVVSAGQAPDTAFARVWDSLQQDLTTLSVRSRRIIAAGSNHQGMGSVGADSVVVAIRDVLDSIAQGGTPNQPDH